MRRRAPGLSTVALLGLVALLVGVVAPARSEEPVRVAFEAWELPVEGLVIADLAGHRETLYVLDRGNHRIHRVEDSRVTDSLGGIGNAPGELFHAAALTVQADGVLWVDDAGNRRLQGLDGRGRALVVVSTAEAPRPWGLAVAGRDVVVGRPGPDAVARRLRADGSPGSGLGRPVEPASEPERPEQRPAHVRAHNRVHLAGAADGRAWMAFLHRDTVRAFGPEGALLWENDGVLAGLDGIDPSRRSSINLDGVQLPVVLKDLVHHSPTDTLWVLTGDDRIVVLDAAGRRRAVVEPTGVDAVLGSLAFLDDGARLVLGGARGADLFVAPRPPLEPGSTPSAAPTDRARSPAADEAGSE